MNTMTEHEMEPNEESFFEDFNSEDTVCDDLSSRGGPPGVEILGIELIADRDDDSALSGLDGSENDSEELRSPPTIDSLELARWRLPHMIVRPGARRRRASPPFGGKLTRFRTGEVDSLILTRRNKPHLIHDSTKHRNTMMKRFEDERGLMDEVDSLTLTRRRLPHLIHKRERPKGPIAEEEERTINGDCYEIVKDEEERTIKEDYYEIIKDEDDDSGSTSTTVSLQSYDSLFTTATVDSLILARKRFGIQPPEEEETPEEEEGEEEQEEDSIASLPSQTAVSNSIPPKITATNVALGGKLRRTSSGACAA